MEHVLVTGATGAVGGRLVPALLDAGHRVRCLVRDPAGLTGAAWRDDVEVVTGDVGDWVSLDAALTGTDAAYYLVHGMETTVSGLLERELALARTFRDVAEAQGLAQLVYLGGLVDEERLATASPHLYSRQQVGVTLAQGRVPVTELRAAIVISPESASFRLLQAAARLPLVLAPPWTRSRCQPIAVADLIAYLVGVLGEPAAFGRVLEVGGADVLTYHEMIRTYLEVVGGDWRPSVTVPYGPPELSAPLASLLAGVDADLALPLLRSAREDAVVRDDRIRAIVPRDPLGFREAVERALAAAAARP